MVSIPRFQAQSPSRPRRHAICWLFLALLLPMTATAADPQPSPHRHIPAKNLIAYFEFDGLDAHAAAWKATSAHAALTKTKAGTMIRDVARQCADCLLESDPPILRGADALAIYDHLIGHGFAVAVHSLGSDAVSITFLLNDFGNKEFRPTFEHLKKDFEFEKSLARVRIRAKDVYVFEDTEEPAGREADHKPLPRPSPKKHEYDKAARPTSPSLTTWFEGNRLIVVQGPSEANGDVADPNSGTTLAEMHYDFVAAILDTTDGKQPNVETHASYRAASRDRKDLKGFEAAGHFFMTSTDDDVLLSYLLRIGNGRNALADKSAPFSPGSKNGSPARAPLVDDDIRKASAEAELLPPVFTDKDLEFLKPNGALRNPRPAIYRRRSPQRMTAKMAISRWRRSGRSA